MEAKAEKNDSIRTDLQQKEEEIERLKSEKNRMEEELNLAKDIQLNMISRDFPAFPHRIDFDLYAKLIPAREVGGDFYDFYLLDENRICFLMADVSGKGVAAGFMMAACKALFKSRAGYDFCTAKIMSHVNHEMATNNPNYMFVTVFLAILNTKTGELTYTNAGHNPSYIKKKDGTLIKLGDLHGPVIAAMERIEFGKSTIQLNKGDVVFAYTDGITEAHNQDSELFSDERLYNLLLKPFKNVKNIVEEVFMNVLLFERGAEQFDDITALCIEYRGRYLTEMENSDGG